MSRKPRSAFDIISAVSNVETEVQRAKIESSALHKEHEELKNLATQYADQIASEQRRREQLAHAHETNRTQLEMKHLVLRQLRQHKNDLLARAESADEDRNNNILDHLTDLSCLVVELADGQKQRHDTDEPTTIKAGTTTCA